VKTCSIKSLDVLQFHQVGATYLLSAYRMTHALYDINGYPVEIVDILNGFYPCPVLILLYWEITKEHEVALPWENDYIMLLCDFLPTTRETGLKCFAFLPILLGYLCLNV
jgi:hypothetical protein